jgi:hypothetical protein
VHKQLEHERERTSGASEKSGARKEPREKGAAREKSRSTKEPHEKAIIEGEPCAT